jgi:hypothetical protein
METNKNKELTVTLRKKTISFLVRRFFISSICMFVFTFIMQHTKVVKCNIIVPNSYESALAFGFNPSTVKSYTKDFKTFFGNKVESDYPKYDGSLNDCQSYSHKAFIYLKATIADYLIIILLSMGLTIILWLLKRYNVKIKIV